MEKAIKTGNKHFSSFPKLFSFPPSKFINPLPHNHEFFITLKQRVCEKIVEKGENAGNQHFLRFPHECFLPYQ